jgi:hypothetical protein
MGSFFKSFIVASRPVWFDRSFGCGMWIDEGIFPYWSLQVRLLIDGHTAI